MDVGALPSGVIREIRRRCHRALQDGEGSPGNKEGHRGAITGLWIGTPSGEDEDRLLQG